MWPPQYIAAIFLALVVLTIMHRTLFGFLLTIVAGFVLAVRIAAWAAAPIPMQAVVSQVESRPPHIVVPEPDPAAPGILLDRWARSSAPLVPLN